MRAQLSAPADFLPRHDDGELFTLSNHKPKGTLPSTSCLGHVFVTTERSLIPTVHLDMSGMHNRFIIGKQMLLTLLRDLNPHPSRRGISV